MTRKHAFILSLAIGLIGITGVFAATRTIGLGTKARAATNAQIAQRSAALDRYAASLQKELARPAPRLPKQKPAPVAAAVASAPAQAAPSYQTAAAPVRVVYHRPPPIVIHKHRAGEGGDAGEHSDD